MMDSKNAIFSAIALVVVIIAIIFFVNDANDGPLENAAEDLDDAVEEIADEIDN